MTRVKSFTIFILVFLYTSSSFAQFNLNVTILQIVGDKKIQTTKSIKSEYDKDIVITHENVKENIVLNLKRVKKILANGNVISPVQIDMRLVGDGEKAVGKPQTVTTFYSQAAQFSIPGIEKDKFLNLSLDFQDI